MERVPYLHRCFLFFSSLLLLLLLSPFLMNIVVSMLKCSPKWISLYFCIFVIYVLFCLCMLDHVCIVYCPCHFFTMMTQGKIESSHKTSQHSKSIQPMCIKYMKMDIIHTHTHTHHTVRLTA